MWRWHEEEGMSSNAIAALLNRDPSTIRRRLGKAPRRVGRPKMSSVRRGAEAGEAESRCGPGGRPHPSPPVRVPQ